MPNDKKNAKNAKKRVTRSQSGRFNKKRKLLNGNPGSSSSSSSSSDKEWEPYSDDDDDDVDDEVEEMDDADDMEIVIAGKSLEMAVAEQVQQMTQTKAALFDIMTDTFTKSAVKFTEMLLEHAEDDDEDEDDGSTPVETPPNEVEDETGKTWRRRLRNNSKEQDAHDELVKKRRIADEMRQLEIELFKTKETDTPLKHRILTMPDEYVNQRSKIAIIRNINKFASMSPSDSGYFKYRDYIEGLEAIPFGRYIEQPVGPDCSPAEIAAATNEFYREINGCLYGQHDAKNKLAQIIHNTWTNPRAAPQVIGLRGAPGIGKCLGTGTPVRMHNGSIKLVEDVKTGDMLMGDDGRARTVLSTCTGRENLYRIKQSHADDYVVNESHILTLQDAYGFCVDIHVRELLEEPNRLTTMRGYRAVFSFSDVGNCSAEEAYAAGRYLMTRQFTRVAPELQLEFVAGVFDFYGELQWTLTVHQVPGDEMECILRSLGFNCSVTRFRKRGFDFTRIKVVNGGIRNPQDIPVREYAGVVDSDPSGSEIQTGMRSMIEIEPLGEGDYYGFEIDGNRRFLLGDFTVTHNTTLIKDGFAKAHGRPFFFCSLGGARDGSDLDGHHFTYEGATCGWLVNCLMSAGVMNPVFFFDELDKVSHTAAGREIIGILMHLIDPSQNDAFHDKYYQGIDFDLSKAIFIFSYNDPDKVDRILMDRITEINMSGYQVQDKLQIVKQYLVREMSEHVGMAVDDVVFTDEVIQYIIREYTGGEAGVRGLRKVIQLLYLKLNILRFKDIDREVMGDSYVQGLTFPLELTNVLVDKLVKEGLKGKDDDLPMGMYL